MGPRRKKRQALAETFASVIAVDASEVGLLRPSKENKELELSMSDMGQLMLTF